MILQSSADINIMLIIYFRTKWRNAGNCKNIQIGKYKSLNNLMPNIRFDEWEKSETTNCLNDAI